VQRCPACGEEYADRFRLCGMCGSILVAQPRGEETRRTITVVFCDLKGSTELGSRLDSEAVREMLVVYFSAMKSILEHHGGTIEKYIGDAIVAVFGIPRAHEDDALRAVRAATEMRAALDEVNIELQAKFGAALANRTGINTGEVLAGDAAGLQLLATGDTMNVAARLEQAAPPGEILLGEETFLLVRHAVNAAPVEPLSLKGKAELVTAYRLVSVAPSETIPRQVDQPLIGRGNEVAALREQFERAVEDRTCRLVTVLGDAGLGKSRTIEEFVASLDDKAHVLQGRCLSYGDGITFWPVAQVVRQAAGIVPADDETEIDAKLSSSLGESLTDVTVRIKSVLGLGPDFAKGEIFWAVRRMLYELGRRRPLVVVFDDIHWAEPTLLDLLEDIVGSALPVPLLLVCAARSELLEERPQWGDGGSSALRIELRELSDDESRLVVQNLLGRSELPEALAQRIVARAQGNPLFVEQMIGMLIDEGLLSGSAGHLTFAGSETSITIPPSVALLLSARLDRLAPTEGVVLGRASVVGLEFSAREVLALSEEGEIGETVRGALGLLCERRLIRADSASPEAFQFGHILIRDAAYDRLLKRTRSQLHERFAWWLSGTLGARLVEHEEIVGYHFEQSFRCRADIEAVGPNAQRIADKAADHLASAGNRALARGDTAAVANLFQRAGTLVHNTNLLGAQFLLLSGEASANALELERAEAVLTEATQRAMAVDDEGTARAASLALLRLRYITNPKAVGLDVLDLAKRAITELEALGDDRALIRAWSLVTYVHWTACRFGAAAASIERVIEHANAIGDVVTVQVQLGNLTICSLNGPLPVASAIAKCQEVLERVTEDHKATALVEVAIGHLEAMRGNFHRARELYNRSRASLGEFGSRFLAATTSIDSGMIEMLAGDLLTAESELRKDYGLLDEMGERNYITTVAGLLSEVLYRQGRYDESAQFATTCKELASDDDVASQMLWRCVLGKLAALEGDGQMADELLGAATSLVASTDHLEFHGNCLMDFAEVCLLAGKPSKATALANEARSIFERKGLTVSAERARELARRKSIPVRDRHA
jgi:class 3 adenylate cyclase